MEVEYEQLVRRYQQYLIERETLKRKVDGRPIPEAKKRLCADRLRDLDERVIPKLTAEMLKSGERNDFHPSC